MARVKIDDNIVALSNGAGVTATVTVQKRFDNSNATLYAAETGGTTVANPVTATNGRLEVWVDEGQYNLVISSTGFTTYTQAFDAIAGASSGKCIIVTTESRTNTAYGLMPTPDRVQNIIVPTDSLLAIGYQATWQSSSTAAAKAAIFIGANQLKIGDGTAPSVQEATNAQTATDRVLATSPMGLVCGAFNGPYSGDVTTGQIVGTASSPASSSAGVCYVFVAAGIYDVSVQFKATTGSVTVKNRKLWVWSKNL